MGLLDFAGVGNMGTRNQGDDSDQSAEEAALSARLKHLGERLDQKSANRPTDAAPASRTDASALARGFRLSTELVAGVLVGAFIGWVLSFGDAATVVEPPELARQVAGILERAAARYV